MPFRFFAPLTAAAVMLTGCGGSVQSTGTSTTVLVTTSIWADVVDNVACEGTLDVEVIIPSGGDPHAFEPSLADREAMDNAALLVANGLSLEEGLDDTIDASAAEGTPVFRVSDHIEGAILDHADQDDHGGEDGGDPHIWFDPMLVVSALPELTAQLIEHAALDPERTETCSREYVRTLEQLDTEIQTIVARVPDDRRKLVTSHDSLAYFAARYGFEVIGTVIPAASTLAEANPAQLEALAELIDDTGVPAIFGERLQSMDDTDALARRVGGVEVVVLDTGSLGPEGGGSDSYVGLLRTAAERVADALG